MAAKHDIQTRVVADVSLGRDEAIAACRRASEPVNDLKRFESNKNQVVVTLLAPTLGGMVTGSKKRRQVGTIGIQLEDGARQGVHLEASIGKYVTMQSKMFGFIPAGPKRLWGRERYFKFFDALENELRAADPSGDVVRQQAER